ncbi:hypothetical protein [Streptomyces sp. NL15-2K]|uniref:hypothetical protein n=1 Tax=Streptomyces sp. NL15-2K TaxID=376149 RepID=UPI00155A5B9B|nr:MULTISPECIES: hypothetical protein [Actinomycetes]WKX15958.1 hypothetical protein Q4V64_54170 [Kutzneria buriramensis]
MVLISVVDADDHHAAGRVGHGGHILGELLLARVGARVEILLPVQVDALGHVAFNRAVQIVLGEVIGVSSQGGGQPCGQSHRYSSVFTTCR